MWKPILVGTAALAIAGSSLVYAQQRFGGPDRGPDRGMQDRVQSWTPEDRAAFLDARIAALRAGLQLTPDQDKNWPAFETAIRDLIKNRRERFEAWHNQQPSTDPTERLKRRADALSSAGASLQRLADAQGPLYASLNDGQKRRFAMLSERVQGRPGMMGRHHGMGHHQHQGMMDRHGMREGRGDDMRGGRGEDRRGGDMRGGRGDEMRGGRGDEMRGGDRGQFRGDRRSDAEGDRSRDGRGPGWRDDRMDGRGGPDWREERDRDFRGRGPGRDAGPMGGEERL